MYQLNIEGKRLSIPQGWNEITLDQLIKIEEAKEKYQESEDQLNTHFMFAGDVFSILSGMDRRDVMNVNANDVLAVVQEIMKEPEYTQIGSFEHKGIRYTLPKPTQNVFKTTVYGSDVKFGQYVDAKNIEQVFADVQAGNLKKLPMMIAIMCEVEGEEWSKDKIKERADQLSDLPVHIALGCAFFFSSSINKYIRATVKYFQEQGGLAKS